MEIKDKKSKKPNQIKKVNLDGIIFSILYKEVSKELNLYIPLVKALWKELSDNQKKNIISEIGCNNIIRFFSIIKCFKYSLDDTIQHSQQKLNTYQGVVSIYHTFNEEIINEININHGKCACGVSIIDENIIQNIETKRFYIIGCVCIEWWGLKRYVNNTIKICKNINENKEIKKYCSFCYREGECKMCKNKKKIKTIFDAWKKRTQTNIKKYKSIAFSTIKFGKYKQTPLISLCRDLSYINFIKSNVFQYKEKDKLIENIDYVRSHLKLYNKYKRFKCITDIF